MPCLGLGLGLQKGNMISSLEPKNVNGNVLSLIANKANKGQVPTSVTKVFSDMSKIRNSVSYSNGASNGDMVGTSTWTTTGSILSSSNNTLTVTGDGVSLSPMANTVTTSGVTGDKYYLSARARVTNSLCSGISLDIRNLGWGSGGEGVAISSPVINQWYDVSLIITATTNINSSGIRNGYVDTATAIGKVMEVQKFLVINLNSLGLSHLSKEQGDELFPFTPTSSTTQMANDCTINNTASNSVSGFNSEVISGKTVNFLKLDGVDDYGAFANVSSLDITSGEFALCTTFRVTTGASFGYILCKNNTGADQQYAIYYSGTSITIFLNGTSYTSSIISQNTWYNIILYRNSAGLITPYLNKVSQTTTTYANALTSQPNMRMGRRETASGYFKGDIATQSIYQATTLDINKIIKAETNIAKSYTGVT